LGVVSEQQEHPEGAVAAQEQPAPPAAEPSAQEPQSDETPTEAPAAAEAPTPDPPAAAETPAAAEAPAAEDAPAPAAEDAPAPAAEEAPAPAAEAEPVGPKILGVAEEKRLPVVKKRLQEKPKREPLPWPELRAAVAATKDGLDIAQLKELFRGFPEKLRDEVTENVRGFQKGARRPVSQHAAKQLARASHTARRMKKNSHPSGEVAQALGQAMAAELIASLEPEKAAQVILPKRDLLERESRQAQRRARDEEDKRRDEQRRKRREDAKSSRQQTSFGGGFAGAKIKGLDEIAALFAEPEAEQPAAEQPIAEPEAPVTPATTAEPEAAAPEAVVEDAPLAGDPDVEAPVTPATTAEPEAQVEGEGEASGDADPA
jgi:hypothetical protein